MLNTHPNNLRRIITALGTACIITCTSSISQMALAEPKPSEVKAAVEQHDYAKAERLLLEVLATNPNNAKAHFIYSEVLAKSGRLGEAKTQLAKAKELDPSLAFASDKTKLAEFEKKLNQTASATTQAHPPTTPSVQPTNKQTNITSTTPASAQVATKPKESGMGWGSIILFLLLGILGLYLIIKLLRKLLGNNNQPNYYGNTPQNMNGGGFGGAMPPQQPSGGGGGIASHLMAGAGGFAAGMLVDRMINGNHAQANEHNNTANQATTDQSGYTPIQNNQPDFSQDSVDYGSNLDSWDSGGGSTDDNNDSW